MTKAVFVAAVLAVQAASAAGQGGGLEIGTTRFYRSAGNQTVVDGFARVPFGVLDSLTRGPNAVATYRLVLTVRDSAGLQLVADSWTRSVPARLLGGALYVRGPAGVVHDRSGGARFRDRSHHPDAGAAGGVLRPSGRVRCAAGDRDARRDGRRYGAAAR